MWDPWDYSFEAGFFFNAYRSLQSRIVPLTGKDLGTGAKAEVSVMERLYTRTESVASLLTGELHRATTFFFNTEAACLLMPELTLSQHRAS